MGKQVQFFLLICSLLVFAACSKEANTKEVSEQLGSTGEQVQKIEGTDLKENEPSEPVQEEAEPVVVDIIDSLTNEVVRSIYPEEMGYGTEEYKTELESWAKEIARGTEEKQGYDQRNTPDRVDVNGQAIKGQPQVILEEAALVDKILAASEKGGEVELPLYITASGYQLEDVPFLNEVVVASFTSYFNPNVVGRNKNIELSSQAIENVIVGSGDHFSFNTTVGPSDEAHGYQPAQEIVNGELVMGIGGGICQTSSTLFNAVDQLGVDYVEWHHHSLPVGYVPPGRDATVSYGGKDFRFLNTTGAPFLIKTIYGSDSLTIEIRTSKEYAKVMKKPI